MAKLNLYVFSINVKTGEIEDVVDEVDDHENDFSSQNPFLLYGTEDGDYVSFDDFAEGCIYVETYVSAEHARKLAYAKAKELFAQFDFARNFLEHYIEGLSK